MMPILVCTHIGATVAVNATSVVASVTARATSPRSHPHHQQANADVHASQTATRRAMKAVQSVALYGGSPQATAALQALGVTVTNLVPPVTNASDIPVDADVVVVASVGHSVQLPDQFVINEWATSVPGRGVLWHGVMSSQVNKDMYDHFGAAAVCHRACVLAC